MYGKEYFDWQQERECELRIKRETARILDEYDPGIRAKVLAKLRAARIANDLSQLLDGRATNKQRLNSIYDQSPRSGLSGIFGGILP